MSAVSRHNSRRAALQALYEWDISGQPQTIAEQFVNDLWREQKSAFDQAYFEQLVQEISHRTEVLDGRLQEFVQRPLTVIDPIERAVLRIACYELCHEPSVPYKVILNEAIELAKVYGDPKGYKFVNGVLDKLARAVRPELQSAS